MNSFESFQKNLEFNSDILYIKKEISTIYKILRDLFSDTEIKGEIERKSKVYSGVKQYINGILNAEQLSFMKKFSYNKTNTYWKIREKNNSEKISPFPSPEKIKLKIIMIKENFYLILVKVTTIMNLDLINIQ